MVYDRTVFMSYMVTYIADIWLTKVKRCYVTIQVYRYINHSPDYGLTMFKYGFWFISWLFVNHMFLYRLCQPNQP